MNLFNYGINRVGQTALSVAHAEQGLEGWAELSKPNILELSN